MRRSGRKDAHDTRKKGRSESIKRKKLRKRRLRKNQDTQKISERKKTKKQRKCQKMIVYKEMKNIRK